MVFERKYSRKFIYIYIDIRSLNNRPNVFAVKRKTARVKNRKKNLLENPLTLFILQLISTLQIFSLTI